jgi:hypothetical protein
VAADGTVAVTYYDFRNNTAAAGLPTDYWFVHAHAHQDLTNPNNWGDEKRVTNSSFNLENAPHSFGGPNLGKYQGLAAAGSSFMIAFAQPHGSDRASIFHTHSCEVATGALALHGVDLTRAEFDSWSVAKNSQQDVMTTKRVEGIVTGSRVRFAIDRREDVWTETYVAPSEKFNRGISADSRSKTTDTLTGDAFPDLLIDFPIASGGFGWRSRR